MIKLSNKKRRFFWWRKIISPPSATSYCQRGKLVWGWKIEFQILNDFSSFQIVKLHTCQNGAFSEITEKSCEVAKNFDLLGNFRCELFFNSNSLVCCSLNLAGKMSRRIAQSSINWAAIAERVPANQRTNFTAFKSKSDKYLRRWVGMNVKKVIRELVG